MARSFFNKKFSDYLGEQRALLDIIARFFPILPTPSATPFASPSPTPTRTPSVTSSVSPTPSASVTPTITPSPSRTPSVTPTRSQTPLPSPSTSPTPSRTPSLTPSPTASATVTPSLTPTPSQTPTPFASTSPTPTRTPSITPSPSSVAISTFIFEIDTNLEGSNQFSFNLPLNPAVSGYNFTVNWGDGDIDTIIPETGTAEILKVYSSPGQYRIQITGTFPQIFFNNSGDAAKVIALERYGNIGTTSYEHAFDGCSNLVLYATDAPNLSGVTSTAYMFRFCNSLQTTSTFSTWDMSTVEDISYMFAGCVQLNDDFGWDTSSVTNMEGVFQNCIAMIGSLPWDTSSVTNMSYMFSAAITFNNPTIDIWDVNNVSNFAYMFYNASAFNRDIGAWDVSSVEAIGMDYMMFGTTIFNQDLTDWCVPSIPLLPEGFATGSGLELANYPLWGTCPIFDNGFIFEVDTTKSGSASNTFVLPLHNGSSYNFNVSWGDGNIETITGSTLTGATHTYASGGNYEIKIGGTFPRITFNNTGDRRKIIDITQWGNIVWSSMENSFRGCSNLDVTASDSPILSGVTNMSSMFNGCTSLTGTTAFNSWNTSTINNMNGTFDTATNFNQPIGSWNTNLVGTMSFMFSGATSFNQNISTWNTGNVINMASMFDGASSFNQNIGSWVTTGVTNMNRVLNGATNFNQNIGSWSLRTAGVTMFDMLNNCGMSTENYSRTLIGWANSVSANGHLPSGTTLDAVNMNYDCVNYITGATYNNAVDARTYLDTGTPAWTIVGDTQSGACPSPTPTPTPSVTSTPTPSITPTPTPTPSS